MRAPWSCDAMTLVTAFRTNFGYKRCSIPRAASIAGVPDEGRLGGVDVLVAVRPQPTE